MRVPRPSVLADYLREALWAGPTLAVVISAALASVLAELPGGIGFYNGDADGARQILTTVAGAIIAVTATVFSLTIVTLELASSQYSPRLLRNFLSDRGTQVVLSTFMGTFTYCLALLRAIPAAASPAALPQAALTGALGLVVASIAALVYYVHHVSQSIRIESILADVEAMTLATIRRVYRHGAAQSLPPSPAGALAVPTEESGFVQAVDLDEMTRDAAAAGVVVALRPVVGEHVVRGTTLGWVWPDAPDARLPMDAMTDLLNRNVEVSFERTLNQDVAFGIRQLVDIAIRAISPAVNDPTTAVDAISHLTVLLCALARREVGHHARCDAGGALRVVLRGYDFSEYLQQACGQIRRYGAGEPAVLVQLLVMLVEVGCQARDERGRAAVAEQVGLVLQDADREIQQPADREAVHAMARKALRAAGGGLDERVSGSGP
ncbi:MAG: DUF2254 domain-containing protein [Euzebyales bacterium]|nr:DUF2254 domain-containing protein [Euzebyales bacterium]